MPKFIQWGREGKIDKVEKRLARWSFLFTTPFEQSMKEYLITMIKEGRVEAYYPFILYYNSMNINTRLGIVSEVIKGREEELLPFTGLLDTNYQNEVVRVAIKENRMGLVKSLIPYQISLFHLAHNAIEYNRIPIIHFLFENNFSFHIEHFQWAVDWDRREIIELFLERNVKLEKEKLDLCHASVFIYNLLEKNDLLSEKSKENLLTRSTLEKNYPLAKYLITKGERINDNGYLHILAMFIINRMGKEDLPFFKFLSLDLDHINVPSHYYPLPTYLFNYIERFNRNPEKEKMKTLVRERKGISWYLSLYLVEQGYLKIKKTKREKELIRFNNIYQQLPTVIRMKIANVVGGKKKEYFSNREIQGHLPLLFKFHHL